MWMIPAVVLLPLIVNLLQWQRDRRRIHRLAATRKAVPSLASISGDPPRVSFLVAAWNEEAAIRACIEAILRLSYCKLEVVLCAGGSDRTWEIASHLSDPRLILFEQRAGDGKQKSLERCLASATGEILYLLDADCLIADTAFARVLSPILSCDEEAVTGIPCTPLPEQLHMPFVLSQCAGRTYTSIYQADYCSGLSGANSAVRREHVQKAGGFTTQAPSGVDYDLGKRLLRLGMRIRYRADASFPIEFHTRVGPYLRQQARWLRNVVILGMRFRNYREVASCLCTSLVGLTMLAVPCLWLIPGVPPVIARLTGAGWGCAFLHACISRLRYQKIAAEWLGIHFPFRVAMLIPLFLLLDFLAWTIPLGQYPVRSLRHRW
jgi:cellulose synthase/poly-beta-1,6-N-acetylglucosamine synthase-like glycosyltransferase